MSGQKDTRQNLSKQTQSQSWNIIRYQDLRCRVLILLLFDHRPAGKRTAHTWPFQQPLGLSAEPCCLLSDQHQTEWRDEIRQDSKTIRFCKRSLVPFPHLSLELLYDVLEKMLVKVLASQEGVAISRLHLKNSLLDLQDRNIKRAASQVIYSNSASKQASLPILSIFLRPRHLVSVTTL